MLIHGDTAAVVAHCDGIVLPYCDVYVVAVAGKGLVDGVIHHLRYQVVKSFHTGVANIHRRAFTHCLKSF